MQYSLLDLLGADNVRLELRAADSAAAIRALNEALAASGYTLPAYADDAIAREQTFPTGLPTEPVPVAIPHADPQNVQRSAVALGVLAEPVAFGQMGSDGSTLVQARVVFLLAIKEQEKQVEMIGQLIRAIQSPGLLGALTEASDAAAALDLLRAAATSIS